MNDIVNAMSYRDGYLDVQFSSSLLKKLYVKKIKWGNDTIYIIQGYGKHPPVIEYVVKRTTC